MSTQPKSTLTLDDIVSFEAIPATYVSADPKNRKPIKSISLGRRGFLGSLAMAGTAAGISALGVFPGAKEASAACVGSLNNTIIGGCPTDVGNCSPACGPSMVNQAACDASDWHQWTGNYRNRPNSCNEFADADGWFWQGGAGECGCSGGCVRSYRCHDGCSFIGGAWVNTICRQTSSGCLCP